MLTRDDCVRLHRCIDALSLAFHRVTDDADYARFEMDLEDIPIDLIEASCLHLRRHSKRFPTVAHIREQADLLPKVKPISSGYHQAHPNDPPFCNRCDDCGWELHSWCENGQCGDHRPHIAHPFTCPCACRSSNPIYREKLKHGAFHKDVD